MDAKDLRDKTQETAQDLLEKGKEVVKDLRDKADESGLTDKVNEIKDNIVDKAKEITSGAKKQIDRNPDLREARDRAEKIAEETGDRLKDAGKEVMKRTEKPREEIMDRAENLKHDAEKKIKDVRRDMRKQDHRNDGNLGRTVAGVALATAAAAGAYTLYRNKKNQEESLKAEFSEKLKRWNEMDDYTVMDEKKIKKMTIRAAKLYSAGSNALLGEDIIINISPVGQEVTFNPEETAEPKNPMEEMKKRAGEIAEMVQDKLMKFSEDVSHKAGELKDNTKEAADRLVEGSKEGFENLKEKAEDAGDDLKYKVENVRSDIKEDMDEAGDRAENLEKKAEKRAENAGKDVKEGAENLREKAGETVENLKEKAGELGENLKKGAENLGENVKEGAEKIKEKAEDIRDNFKEKAEERKETAEDNKKYEELKKDRKEVGQDEAFKIRKELEEENPGCRLNDAIEKREEDEILENKSESKNNNNGDNIERITIGKTVKKEGNDKAPEATEEEKALIADKKEVGAEVSDKMVFNPGAEGRVTVNGRGDEEKPQAIDSEIPREGDKDRVFRPGARNEKIENMVSSSDDDRNIDWEEDKSMIMKKGEELKDAAASGFEALKNALSGVREQIKSAVETVSSEDKKHEENEEEDHDENTITEEFNVTIHNKGNKDYFFSPMLIQSYNTKTRTTCPCPTHEEGTDLEKKIIKPGETYTGKIAIKMGENDDALIVFEDMMLNNSIAVLLKEEDGEEYGKKEKEDLVDDLLFDDEEYADDKTMSLDREFKEELKNGPEEQF